MIDPNTIIGGRYRVTRPLGGGGMKLVYLAEDLRLAARPCALAEMVDSFTDPGMQKNAVAAFQREADMLAQLSNEHIPRVFDRFSEQNHHYLVMEFVDGVTLEQELKVCGGKLSEERVIDIALQVLETLEYLHNLAPPVIYRDLKPSNVMLARNAQVKLIDFGIARVFLPQSNATMIGTQGYAPPEQYRGRAESRSDLYALGATMHHALSGRDPAAEAPFSFPPISSLCPKINPALAALVDQALQYDVVLRMGTAAEFKQRLLQIRDGASARAVANGGVAGAPKRPAQQPLPLREKVAPSTGSSPEAATVLVHPQADVECIRCGRLIPDDSRFCSFCGTNLGPHALHDGTADGSSEAATIVLRESPEPLVYSPPRPRDAGGDVNRHVRSEPRHSRFALGVFITLVLFVIAFGITAAVNYFHELTGPDQESSGIAPLPDYRSPDAAEPEHRTARAKMLRHALDVAGYRQVHFQLEGDTAILWGRVPSQFDRVQIQVLAVSVGIVSLEDHIIVSGSPYAGTP